MHLKPFLLTALDSATTGGRRYHLWMGSLTAIILVGAYAYSLQLRYGLGVTGMSDQVSWGLYISNFTFLVGMAAAAMMLVLPAYILDDVDFGRAVLMAEGGRRGGAGHVPSGSWWWTSATHSPGGTSCPASAT